MLQLAGSGTPGITPPDDVDVVVVPPEELGSPVDVSPPLVEVELLVVEVVLVVVVVSPPLVEVVLVVPPVVLVVPPVVVEAVPPVDVLVVGQVIVEPFGPSIVPPAGGQVAVAPPPPDPPPPPRIVPLGLGTSLKGARADEPPLALAPLACPDRAPTMGGVASLNANSCDAGGRVPNVGATATGARRLVLITGTRPERRSGVRLAEMPGAPAPDGLAADCATAASAAEGDPVMIIDRSVRETSATSTTIAQNEPS